MDMIPKSVRSWLRSWLRSWPGSWLSFELARARKQTDFSDSGWASFFFLPLRFFRAGQQMRPLASQLCQRRCCVPS
jgi:hypothetical protein